MAFCVSAGLAFRVIAGLVVRVMAGLAFRVMAGLGPAIHDLRCWARRRRGWLGQARPWHEAPYRSRPGR